MTRPHELVRQHQFAGSGCVSTLSEIAFVIALTAQQDDVLPTWKIKMILGRLAGPDDRVKPMKWSHLIAFPGAC